MRNPVPGFLSFFSELSLMPSTCENFAEIAMSCTSVLTSSPLNNAFLTKRNEPKANRVDFFSLWLIFKNENSLCLLVSYMRYLLRVNADILW